MKMKLVTALTPDAERAVVEAVQQGDRAAFAEFLRRQEPWIRGIIFAVVGKADRVDDVAQQVFTALWSRFGELKDATSWRPWVYRLARNAALDAGRELARRKGLQERLADVFRLNKPAAPPPTKELMEQERHRLVLSAIESLPAIYREPFVLRHLEGWNYEQIGQTMNLPVDTVETRLVRARRLLRSALDGKV